MSYKLFILPRAAKELDKLHGKSFERAKKAIEKLASEPRGAACRKLRGRDGWRLRVGDYRVVFEIDDLGQRVVVLHVGHRKNIYR